jgi:hypothetical protein
MVKVGLTHLDHIAVCDGEELKVALRGDQDEVVVYRLVEARLDLRQRSSAFVSIRQHSSAFVSICQHLSRGQ